MQKLVIVSYMAEKADLDFEGKIIKLFSKLGYFLGYSGFRKKLRLLEFHPKKG